MKGDSRQQILDVLAGRHLVLGMSGGKDSTACAAYFRRLGVSFHGVFIDTGWEHPLTYRYVRDVLDPLFGPIRTIKSAKYPNGMRDLVLGRGMFPSRIRRMCTQELKVFPMRDLLRADDLPAEPVSAVGIRRAESRARSRMEEWEYSSTYDCDVWRPIIDWTDDDVVAAHLEADITPNPLYLRGLSRVGCWPCIMARKSEIRKVSELDPARIDELRELERLVAEAAARRYGARGETFESLGYQRPSYFQAKVGGVGDTWPIDKVVEWASTARGGFQWELFAPSEYEEQGCVRWGLCESNVVPTDEAMRGIT